MCFKYESCDLSDNENRGEPIRKWLHNRISSSINVCLNMGDSANGHFDRVSMIFSRNDVSGTNFGYGNSLLYGLKMVMFDGYHGARIHCCKHEKLQGQLTVFAESRHQPG